MIEQYNLIRETTRSISFPESHDTPRLCQEMNGNLAGLKQRYLFAALFSAGVMMPIGFEFGFRKPLHVVNTTPADWEKTDVDLTSFIAKVNAVKKGHSVFHEESPTSIFPCQNPNVLLMWKASAKHKDEALLILNKDPHQHQEFSIRPLPALRPVGGAAARCLPGTPSGVHSRAFPLRPASRARHRAGDLAAAVARKRVALRARIVALSLLSKPAAR